MRKALFVAVALAAAAVAFSLPRTVNPVADTLKAMIGEKRSSEMGSMTVADLEEAVARLSVAMQQEAWIHGSAMASMMMPGLGQLRNGDALGGSLYLAADIAVKAGAMVGAWFLLPGDVQLNYFTTPISTIETAWRSHTVADYLPSLGVMAAGVLLECVLRGFSASGAARLAERGVADGTVTFEPVLIGSGRGMGFGMRVKRRPGK